MTILTVVLSLTAAAVFGLIVHIQNRALDDTDGLTGSVVQAAAMAGALWLASPMFMDGSWWLTRGTLLFAACGLIFPAASSRLQIASVPIVGPALSSAIGAAAPLFAVLPGVVFLHEPFGLQSAAGLALIVGSLAVSALNPRGMVRGWPLWALLLPLGAAFARGVVQPVTKVGYLDVPSPPFATMVMATASTVVLMTVLAARQRPATLFTPRRGYLWFALSGLMTGTGILLFNTALAVGDIVVAAPLAATTPLWSLAYGAFVFRREKLHLRHAIVALLVVIGAVLIVTS